MRKIGSLSMRRREVHEIVPSSSLVELIYMMITLLSKIPTSTRCVWTVERPTMNMSSTIIEHLVVTYLNTVERPKMNMFSTIIEHLLVIFTGITLQW